MLRGLQLFLAAARRIIGYSAGVLLLLLGQTVDFSVELGAPQLLTAFRSCSSQTSLVILQFTDSGTHCAHQGEAMRFCASNTEMTCKVIQGH